MTDRYLVVGNPIAHSKSPAIHAAFAQQTGQAVDYQAALLAVDQFDTQMKTLMAQGIRGFNVTLPFKTQAVALADRLDPVAALAQAVNTLALTPDGQWVGYNTDGQGLVADLTQFCGQPIGQQKILVLGAGGAVRGVLPALLAAKPALIHVLNRTHQTAVALADALGAPVSAVSPNELLSGYDLIINGTSASVSGAVPDVPVQVFGSDTRCYDMMYGAQETVFMQWARQQGATQVWDGLGMLVEQAAAAFAIWRGIQPDTAALRAQLRAGMKP